MAKPAKSWVAERRAAARGDVDTILPVRLVAATSGDDLRCRILDVADVGLCVLVDRPLPEGAEVVFVTLPERFQLTVAWCRPEADQGYRCGLRLRGSEANLRSIFARYITAA